jgi:hypothetical protein
MPDNNASVAVSATAPFYTPSGSSASGTSGALVRIEQVVVTGSVAATIDFSNIAQTYEDLILHLLARGDTAAAAVEVRARFNNDSAANYDHAAWGMGGNGTATAATGGRFGAIPAASATAGKAGVCELIVPGYARTVFEHQAMGHDRYNTSDAFGTVDETQMAWRSTAAINRITIYPFAGNFEIGTVATLYGLT